MTFWQRSNMSFSLTVSDNEPHLLPFVMAHQAVLMATTPDQLELLDKAEM